MSFKEQDPRSPHGTDGPAAVRKSITLGQFEIDALRSTEYLTLGQFIIEELKRMKFFIKKNKRDIYIKELLPNIELKLCT